MDGNGRRGRASVIVIQDGKVILIHRFRNGEEYWVLPGGGIEGDETAQQAAVRELKEELGLEAVSSRLVHEGVYDGNIHTSYIFLCEVDKVIGKLSNPEEYINTETDIHTPEWVEIEKIDNLILYPEAAKKLLRNLS